MNLNFSKIDSYLKNNIFWLIIIILLFLFYSLNKGLSNDFSLINIFRYLLLFLIFGLFIYFFQVGDVFISFNKLDEIIFFLIGNQFEFKGFEAFISVISILISISIFFYFIFFLFYKKKLKGKTLRLNSLVFFYILISTTIGFTIYDFQSYGTGELDYSMELTDLHKFNCNEDKIKELFPDNFTIDKTSRTILKNHWKDGTLIPKKKYSFLSIKDLDLKIYIGTVIDLWGGAYTLGYVKRIDEKNKIFFQIIPSFEIIKSNETTVIVKPKSYNVMKCINLK